MQETKRCRKTKRQDTEEMSTCNFAGYKISQVEKIQPAATALPSATPANQNTKNYENVHMKMRKITKKTKIKLRKLCKITNKT